MTLNEYQEKAQSFDLTINTLNHKPHAVFQFLEEAGEVAGIFKRELRGDGGYLLEVDFKEKLMGELGDALWGLAAICASHNITLGKVAERNIQKLEDRKARNQIKGEGGER